MTILLGVQKHYYELRLNFHLALMMRVYSNEIEAGKMHVVDRCSKVECVGAIRVVL